MSNPRVVIKRHQLDQIRKNSNGSNKDLLSGDEWYKADAIRAVNQSIGRTIRHQNDYGSAIIIDSRMM